MLALEVKNLRKVYKETVALESLNLEMKEGSFFGLLGPNGAGKTTLIGIISSLINKTSGEVKVFGHDLSQENNKVKSCIGIVPQEFNFSIFEKISSIVSNQAGYYGITREKAKKSMEKYLKILDLWDKRDQIAAKLSGGMKRRLMIARALVHEPRMLILDEPTAGVDIELRRSMWSFLRKLNAEGTSIILTTHYLEEAENLCRDIAIINEGIIVEHGSTRSLLKKLHLETFVFDLAEPMDTVPLLKPFKSRLTSPQVLEVDINGGQKLNTLFTEFSNKKVSILSMRSKANRLEELFMRLLKK